MSSATTGNTTYVFFYSLQQDSKVRKIYESGRELVGTLNKKEILHAKQNNTALRPPRGLPWFGEGRE